MGDRCDTHGDRNCKKSEDTGTLIIGGLLCIIVAGIHAFGLFNKGNKMFFIAVVAIAIMLGCALAIEYLFAGHQK